MDPASAEPLSTLDVPPPEDERQLGPPPPPPPAAPRRPSPAWALVRAVVVPIVAFIAQGLVVVGAMILTGAFKPLGGHVNPEDIGRNVAVMFAAYIPSVAVILLAWHLLDRGTLAEIGHPGPPTRILRGLGFGFLGGIGLMALIVALGIVLGGWRIHFSAADSELAWLGWTPFIILAAYFEELLSRGYMLQNLGRRAPLLGLLLSSVVFAALHLANPNTGEGAGFTVILVTEIFMAGILLGALYLLSGDLWLPTGVHVGWNWAQGILFGLPVSGIDVPSIGHAELLEPSLLTGSSFGPESSLVALALTTLAAAACLVMLGRRGIVLPLDANKTRPRPDEVEAVPLPPPPEIS